jgi:transposase
MEAETIELDAISAMSETNAAPFAQVVVTLTKLEHIQLVMEARSWKSLHQRAVSRLQQLQDSTNRFVAQLRAHAEHCEATLHAELALAQEAATQREAALRAELELAKAKVRDLQQRLFGRKSERSKGASELQPRSGYQPARRGQRRGAPGHGRKMLAHLPERIETVGLDSPQCPACGEPLDEFPGTEDSEVLEIEVKAYRRLIRRRRYRPTCRCGCAPGIVTAPAPNRLIERGKFGVSVWATVLLDKYLYGRPSHRLLQDLGHHGLNMSPGTLAGGLQTVGPLFDPIVAAMLAKLRSEQHWHADETRWAVFVPMDGKVGHRWYLWVYHSSSVVHYVLDPSRSARVVEDELGEVAWGIISCDRYSAYKKFARLHPTFLLAFCWAHQRRDFLELGNAHPLMLAWAMTWVDAIAQLYRLNDLRLEEPRGSAQYAEHDIALRKALQDMADQRARSLSEAPQCEPALKVLRSMARHWAGLLVFVDHPAVPMDNNIAERAHRTPVVGRKNFYGSGSLWSGQLAAAMYTVLMTVKLHKINPRTWLLAYLQACCDAGNRAPQDIRAFLPWTMTALELAAMRACRVATLPTIEGLDTS